MGFNDPNTSKQKILTKQKCPPTEADEHKNARWKDTQTDNGQVVPYMSPAYAGDTKKIMYELQSALKNVKGKI